MTRTRCRNEQGFTLIETMVALGILTVGVLGMAQVMAFTLAISSDSGSDLIAHEKATEAIESVFTARDTRTITWAKIRNQFGETGADGGVFLDGPQPLKSGGNDGLINTGDMNEVLEVIKVPGPNGQLGDGDDVDMPLDSFTREIKITAVPGNPNLRRLKVTIKYRSGKQIDREFSVDTFISAFA